MRGGNEPLTHCITQAWINHNLFCSPQFSITCWTCLCFWQQKLNGSSHCIPFYGSALWKLNQEALRDWRKCVRRILKIDYRNHSRFLSLLLNKADIRIHRYNRWLTNRNKIRLSKYYPFNCTTWHFQYLTLINNKVIIIIVSYNPQNILVVYEYWSRLIIFLT